MYLIVANKCKYFGSTYFVAAQCKEVANDFRKDPSSVKAFTGQCYDQKAGILEASEEDCKLSSSLGREIDVRISNYKPKA